MTNIIKIATTEPDRRCMQLKRLHDDIDIDIIYSGPRTIEIVLYELHFGFFIRKEQYQIYQSICQEIDSTDKNKTYNIYQLLMGRGKSSTILPLITMRYHLITSTTTAKSNVMIVVPTHLLTSTRYNIVDKFSPCWQIRISVWKNVKEILLLFSA